MQSQTGSEWAKKEKLQKVQVRFFFKILNSKVASHRIRLHLNKMRLRYQGEGLNRLFEASPAVLGRRSYLGISVHRTFEAKSCNGKAQEDKGNFGQCGK